MSTVTIDQAMRLAGQSKAAGRLEDAEQIYRQILAAYPLHLPALNQLGIVLGEANRLAEAREMFQKAATTDPMYVDAWVNLSLACEKLEDFDHAIVARRRAIDLKIDAAENWHRLGVCLGKKGELRPAIEVLRKGWDLNPAADGLRHDLVVALCREDQLDSAAEIVSSGLVPKPADVETLKVLADALKRGGRFEDSTELWGRAVEANPSSSDAHGQWAMCLLTQGDFDRGWREYESRWDCDTFTSVRREAKRQWGLPQTVGRPDVSGKTILLYGEQGIGDTIQFVRYASVFAKRGARVIVQCPWPLKSLLETCAGVRLVYGHSEELPNYDWHIPMLSLPWALETTIQNIPAEVPYVRTDPSRSKPWLGRIGGAAGDGLRVGLAWAGNPIHNNDSNRSIDPTLLSVLANVQGATFFSLQKSNENEKAATPPPGLKLVDFTGALCDFAETAALIEHLDLVISADTAVAHLAGALGKPVWTLIPFVPDFRWMLKGADSPWYPTMRLFRQEAYGDWTTVISKVVSALKEKAVRS